MTNDNSVQLVQSVRDLRMRRAGGRDTVIRSARLTFRAMVGCNLPEKAMSRKGKDG